MTFGIQSNHSGPRPEGTFSIDSNLLPSSEQVLQPFSQERQLSRKEQAPSQQDVMSSRDLRLQVFALQTLVSQYGNNLEVQAQLQSILQEALLLTHSGKFPSIDASLAYLQSQFSSEASQAFQAFFATEEGRRTLDFLRQGLNSRGITVLLQCAQKLAPTSQYLERVLAAGAGLMAVRDLASLSSFLSRDAFTLGRDFLYETQSSLSRWGNSFEFLFTHNPSEIYRHWSESLFSQSPTERRQNSQVQAAENLMRVVTAVSHQRAEEAMQGSLGRQVGLNEIEGALGRASILFSHSMSDRISMLSNYAASVTSGYASYVLSKGKFSGYALALSALLGGLNGAVQSSIQLTQQIGNMNSAQIQEQRFSLAWQFLKGVLIGVGSGTGEHLVGRVLHPLPFTNPFLRMGIGVTAFCLGDVGAEILSTQALSWLGVRMHLEEEHILEARGLYGFAANSIDELGGGLTSSVSPVNLLSVNLMNAGAVGAGLGLAEDNSVSRPNENSIVTEKISISRQAESHSFELKFQPWKEVCQSNTQHLVAQRDTGSRILFKAQPWLVGGFGEVRESQSGIRFEVLEILPTGEKKTGFIIVYETPQSLIIYNIQCAALPKGAGQILISYFLRQAKQTERELNIVEITNNRILTLLMRDTLVDPKETEVELVSSCTAFRKMKLAEYYEDETPPNEIDYKNVRVKFKQSVNKNAASQVLPLATGIARIAYARNSFEDFEESNSDFFPGENRLFRRLERNLNIQSSLSSGDGASSISTLSQRFQTMKDVLNATQEELVLLNFQELILRKSAREAQARLQRDYSEWQIELQRRDESLDPGIQSELQSFLSLYAQYALCHYGNQMPRQVAYLDWVFRIAFEEFCKNLDFEINEENKKDRRENLHRVLVRFLSQQPERRGVGFHPEARKLHKARRPESELKNAVTQEKYAAFRRGIHGRILALNVGSYERHRLSMRVLDLLPAYIDQRLDRSGDSNLLEFNEDDYRLALSKDAGNPYSAEVQRLFLAELAVAEDQIEKHVWIEGEVYQKIEWPPIELPQNSFISPQGAESSSKFYARAFHMSVAALATLMDTFNLGVNALQILNKWGVRTAPQDIRLVQGLQQFFNAKSESGVALRVCIDAFETIKRAYPAEEFPFTVNAEKQIVLELPQFFFNLPWRKMSTAELIQHYLEHFKVADIDLAAAAGLKQETIKNYRLGEIHLMSPETIEGLVGALAADNTALQESLRKLFYFLRYRNYFESNFKIFRETQNEKEGSVSLHQENLNPALASEYSLVLKSVDLTLYQVPTTRRLEYHREPVASIVNGEWDHFLVALEDRLLEYEINAESVSIREHAGLLKRIFPTESLKQIQSSRRQVVNGKNVIAAKISELRQCFQLLVDQHLDYSSLAHEHAQNPQTIPVDKLKHMVSFYRELGLLGEDLLLYHRPQGQLQIGQQRVNYEIYPPTTTLLHGTRIETASDEINKKVEVAMMDLVVNGRDLLQRNTWANGERLSDEERRVISETSRHQLSALVLKALLELRILRALIQESGWFRKEEVVNLKSYLQQAHGDWSEAQITVFLKLEEELEQRSHLWNRAFEETREVVLHRVVKEKESSPSLHTVSGWAALNPTIDAAITSGPLSSEALADLVFYHFIQKVVDLKKPAQELVWSSQIESILDEHLKTHTHLSSERYDLLVRVGALIEAYNQRRPHLKVIPASAQTPQTALPSFRENPLAYLLESVSEASRPQVELSLLRMFLNLCHQKNLVEKDLSEAQVEELLLEVLEHFTSLGLLSKNWNLEQISKDLKKVSSVYGRQWKRFKLLSQNLSPLIDELKVKGDLFNLDTVFQEIFLAQIQSLMVDAKPKSPEEVVAAWWQAHQDEFGKYDFVKRQMTQDILTQYYSRVWVEFDRRASVIPQVFEESWKGLIDFKGPASKTRSEFLDHLQLRLHEILNADDLFNFNGEEVLAYVFALDALALVRPQETREAVALAYNDQNLIHVLDFLSREESERKNQKEAQDKQKEQEEQKRKEEELKNIIEKIEALPDASIEIKEEFSFCSNHLSSLISELEKIDTKLPPSLVRLKNELNPIEKDILEFRAKGVSEDKLILYQTRQHLRLFQVYRKDLYGFLIEHRHFRSLLLVFDPVYRQEALKQRNEALVSTNEVSDFLINVYRAYSRNNEAKVRLSELDNLIKNCRRSFNTEENKKEWQQFQIRFALWCFQHEVEVKTALAHQSLTPEVKKETPLQNYPEDINLLGAIFEETTLRNSFSQGWEKTAARVSPFYFYFRGLLEHAISDKSAVKEILDQLVLEADKLNAFSTAGFEVDALFEQRMLEIYNKNQVKIRSLITWSTVVEKQCEEFNLKGNDLSIVSTALENEIGGMDAVIKRDRVSFEKIKRLLIFEHTVLQLVFVRGADAHVSKVKAIRSSVNPKIKRNSDILPVLSQANHEFARYYLSIRRELLELPLKAEQNSATTATPIATLPKIPDTESLRLLKEFLTSDASVSSALVQALQNLDPEKIIFELPEYINRPAWMPEDPKIWFQVQLYLFEFDLNEVKALTDWAKKNISPKIKLEEITLRQKIEYYVSSRMAGRLSLFVGDEKLLGANAWTQSNVAQKLEAVLKNTRLAILPSEIILNRLRDRDLNPSLVFSILANLLEEEVELKVSDEQLKLLKMLKAAMNVLSNISEDDSLKLSDEAVARILLKTILLDFKLEPYYLRELSVNETLRRHYFKQLKDKISFSGIDILKAKKTNTLDILSSETFAILETAAIEEGISIEFEIEKERLKQKHLSVGEMEEYLAQWYLVRTLQRPKTVSDFSEKEIIILNALRKNPHEVTSVTFDTDTQRYAFISELVFGSIRNALLFHKAEELRSKAKKMSDEVWNRQLEQYFITELEKRREQVARFQVERCLNEADEIINIMKGLRAEYIAWFKQEYPQLKLNGNLSNSNTAKAVVRILQASDTNPNIRLRFDARIAELKSKFQFSVEAAISIAYLELREEVLEAIPNVKKTYQKSDGVLQAFVSLDSMPMPLDRLIELTLKRPEFQEIMKTLYLKYWIEIIKKEYVNPKQQNISIMVKALAVFSMFLESKNKSTLQSEDNEAFDGLRDFLEKTWQEALQNDFKIRTKSTKTKIEETFKIASNDSRSYPELSQVSYLDFILFRTILGDLNIIFPTDVKVDGLQARIIHFMIQIIVDENNSDLLRSKAGEVLMGYDDNAIQDHTVRAGIFERYKVCREELLRLLAVKN